jgi:hypothetical protein
MLRLAASQELDQQTMKVAVPTLVLEDLHHFALNSPRLTRSSHLVLPRLAAGSAPSPSWNPLEKKV